MKNKQAIAEEKMLVQYNNLIMKLSQNVWKRYHGKYSLEDLVQEAKIGAVRAFRIYDVTKETKLITHLYNYINFYLSHYIRSDTGIIKIPKSAFTENKKIPEIVDNDLYEESFLNERCLQASFADQSIINKVLLEEYCSVLSDKEKNILYLIYNQGYTFKEVANIYGVSRQFANMIANKAIDKLKTKFENHY
jgi:RNA polymerase sigma factor (sigma-70 family)